MHALPAPASTDEAEIHTTCHAMQMCLGMTQFWKKPPVIEPAGSDAHVKVRSKTSASQAAGEMRRLSGFHLPIYSALLILSGHKDGNNGTI